MKLDNHIRHYKEEVVILQTSENYNCIEVTYKCNLKEYHKV